MEKQLQALEALKEKLKDEKKTEEHEAIDWALKELDKEKERNKKITGLYIGALTSYFEMMNEYLPEWKYHNRENIDKLIIELTKVEQSKRNQSQK